MCVMFFVANDCFELGRLSYNKGDYYHGILWLEESLQRLGKECSPSADEGKLLDYLAFSVYKVRTSVTIFPPPHVGKE